VTLPQIIGHYVETRRTRMQPLSLAKAVKAVRKVQPHCSLSDRALGDLIAMAALQHGLCIELDLSALGQPDPLTA
jgi:hypothetical protein